VRYWHRRGVCSTAWHGRAFRRLDASTATGGLIPLSAHGRGFAPARSSRAFVQRTLRTHLAAFQEEQPLARFPHHRVDVPRRALLLDRSPSRLARQPGYRSHGHTVPPAVVEGGSEATARRLEQFLASSLACYADGHAQPDADCTSRLSPYLHSGTLAASGVLGGHDA
jgi:deoxyribodipyrimidine photolyase